MYITTFLLYLSLVYFILGQPSPTVTPIGGKLKSVMSGHIQTGDMIEISFCLLCLKWCNIQLLKNKVCRHLVKHC